MNHLKWIKYTKRSRSSCALILLFCSFCWATPSMSELNQTAHNAFGKGEYQKAKQGYEAVLTRDPLNQTAWYNLGTTEAHLGEFGRGAYALQQALILAPHDQDAQVQLSRVNQAATEDGMRRPGSRRLILPDEISSQGGLLALISLKWMKIISWLCGSLACFFLFSTRRLSRNFKTNPTLDQNKYVQKQAFLRVCLLSTAILALLSFGVWTLKDQEVNQTVKGIVIDKRTPLYRGPGGQFEVDVNIAGGVKVELQGKEKEWQRVVLSSGQEGWINEKQIRVLSKTPLFK